MGTRPPTVGPFRNPPRFSSAVGNRGRRRTICIGGIRREAYGLYESGEEKIEAGVLFLTMMNGRAQQRLEEEKEKRRKGGIINIRGKAHAS